jgi:hypothetical protein
MSALRTPWVWAILAFSLAVFQPPLAAEESWSPDHQVMKERLIALSKGDGPVDGLRIEVMDGDAMHPRMGIYLIAGGKVDIREWSELGGEEKRKERVYAEEDIRKLLADLIQHEYWTFQGETFYPDGGDFLFRIQDSDLPPVEYRCGPHEYRQSPQRLAIRRLLLEFVAACPCRY